MIIKPMKDEMNWFRNNKVIANKIDYKEFNCIYQVINACVSTLSLLESLPEIVYSIHQHSEMMNSRVLVNLAPVNLGPSVLLVLVMEEEWSLNGHHGVHGDKDKRKEEHDGQDADKRSWAKHFLNVHVVEREGANLGDGIVSFESSTGSSC